MIVIIIFLLGLCVGSFLNVIIYRETVEEQKAENSKQKTETISQRTGKKIKINLPSWFWGRSCCDYCKKQISWFDNIPLLSYLWLRGKCRYCHKSISFQYPLVEFLTGIEFVWVYFLIKENLDFFSRFEGFYSIFSLILWLAIGASLIAIFIADMRYQLIPDAAISLGIFFTLVKFFIDYRYTAMLDFSIFPSAILACLFFLSLFIATKGKGMGFGDVKLAFFIGLLLGFPNIIIAIFMAFLTGAVVGVILILLEEKKLKSKIAFGPFLIAGTIFALFYGKQIWFYFS